MSTETPREPDPGREGAVFAPTRLRAAARTPLLAALAIAGLGGLIALGALEQPDGDPSTTVPTLVADAPTAAAPTRPRRTGRPSAMPSTVPGEPDLMALDLRPAGSHLFVHGDVFSMAVVVIVVSVQDTSGHVVAIREVDIPTGSAGFATGANERFVVRFDLPDEVMGEGLWIEASAYDDSGLPIATSRAPVVPDRVFPV